MKKFILYIIILSVVSVASCRQDYVPKPRGYMKVEYPEKEYTEFDTTAPFSFEYPVYAEIVPDTSPNAEKYWYNIKFPPFDATIYLSYKDVNNNLNEFVEDSRTLAYKHTIKAEAIDESLIHQPEKDVYGILYDFSGNTATSLQFFVSDSSRHFLRGSLYFNTTPEKDSLAPVVSFLREDILHLLDSFEWEKE
jgi:gliding motility-associated lipoprotein GldD